MGMAFNPFTGNFDIKGSGGGGGGSVTSVNGQTGVVVIEANDVPYDNTSSGLTATNVQDAIDEVVSNDSATERKVELRTISAGEATAKQLTLADTPTTSNFTVLEIAEAPSQFYGTDFTVTGNVLSWSGLALDGILTAGDNLTIIYN